MSSLQMLQLLVKRCLSAAAEEICKGLEKTLMDFEQHNKQEILRLRSSLQLERLQRETRNQHQDHPQLALSVWDEEVSAEMHQDDPGTRKNEEEFGIFQEDEVEVIQETEEGNSIRIILRAPYVENPLEHLGAKAELDPVPGTSAQTDHIKEELCDSSGSAVECDSSEEWGGVTVSPSDSDETRSETLKTEPTGPKGNPAKKNKPRINCKICEKPFHAIVSLVNHLEVHPKDICGVCRQYFDTAEQFDAHLKTHVKAEVCSVCGKCFGTAKALEMHTRVHTGEKPFLCNDCGKSFNCRHNMVRHSRIHTGEKPYSCSICEKSFNDYSTLKRHLLTHNNKKAHVPNVKGNNNDNGRGAEPKVAVQGKNQTRGSICEVCGKMFHSMVSLVNHAKNHTTNLCGVCGTHFDSAENLKLHLKTHKNGKVCEVCGKCFDSQGNLENHMRIHTGEKPFLCNECGKSFNCRHNMMRHMRTHTGEKPYLCNVCGRCFSDHTTLKQHSSTHTGEKPHSCHICGKGFHRKTYLRLHMKNHTTGN